jgi:nucleoside-diphosphate-sugar epimerase
MILLTGISGFIAQHLVKELQSDYDLIGLSRNSQVVEGLSKVYTWEQLDELPPVKWCIHLAGLAHDISGNEEDDSYDAVNVGLTKKLFTALQGKCESFLYFSSIKAVTNFAAKQLNENTICNPEGAYGLSKRNAEQWLLAQKSETYLYIFRPVMLYGKGSKGNINALISWVKRGWPYPFGAYQNEKSVLYIKNLRFVVRKFIALEPPPGIYHVADKGVLSSSQLVEFVAKATHKKLKIWKWPRGLKPLIFSKNQQAFRVAKLNKLLGDLSVDTDKLQNALNREELPFSTENAFKDFLK